MGSPSLYGLPVVCQISMTLFDLRQVHDKPLMIFFAIVGWLFKSYLSPLVFVLLERCVLSQGGE